MKRRAITTMMPTLFLTSMLFMTCARAPAALVLEGVRVWYWVDDTEILSVAVGDVDNDLSAEILTGGYYNDGSREVAQLCVWDGSTLELEGVRTWYWVGDTEICSVAMGDVDGDGDVEIITGGYYDDGTRFRAQLCVWDGSTMNLEDVKTWYWTSNTEIYSVAVGDVDGDGDVEIVTGGYYYDGTRDNAQLAVLDGAALTLEGVKTWYWTDDTGIASVAVGQAIGGGGIEIVTGGWYWNGTCFIAQLVVWDGSTLTVEFAVDWYTVWWTAIYSVALEDADGDGAIETVTGGYYWDDSVGYRAELKVFYFYESPPGFKGWGCEAEKSWDWESWTFLKSVAVGDVDGDVEIVTGGCYWDGDRYEGQLAAWTKT